MTQDRNAYDTLPDAVTELFGEEATAERAYDLLTVDVPTASWIAALEIARDKLGCTYFDWLSAVDEPGTGFRVCAHVASLGTGHVRRLLLRTTVPHAAPSLPSAVAVYAGAGWHERETYEMFGVTFTDHPHLVHLLLPENFEGHPLRKDFVLAARVAKAWPGAKEPGESHDPNAPKRRQMLPPGVPDPNEWGPLKGQLPAAPARPARAAAGDRPVRRTRTAAEGSATQPDPSAPVRRSRSVSEGSASQAGQEGQANQEGPAGQVDPSAPVRRSRSASEGSASQASQAGQADPSAPVRRSRSASEGSASQASQAGQADPSAPVRRSRSASAGSASQRAQPPAPAEAPAAPAPEAPAAPAAPEAQEKPAPRTRSADAPWHHARPAFDEKPGADEDPGPKDEAPSEPAPKDQAPKDEAPTDQAPTDQAPKDEAADEQAPKAQAPKAQAPKAQAPDEPPADPHDTPAGGDPA
ncbi:NADH-quinone oxidoreductase subunit C [Streptomyces sp. NPDC092046]|uniref:NADH-quinone oxidoreductase subunit C n=1 Tax=Streptomyces sp. NPDC092046 TaxID=3366009 RepID=UPI0038146331